LREAVAEGDLREAPACGWLREAARRARLREAGGSLTGAPCGKRRAERD